MQVEAAEMNIPEVLELAPEEQAAVVMDQLEVITEAMQPVTAAAAAEVITEAPDLAA
jgi:hypothetical protein